MAIGKLIKGRKSHKNGFFSNLNKTLQTLMSELLRTLKVLYFKSRKLQKTLLLKKMLEKCIFLPLMQIKKVIKVLRLK